MSASLSKTVVIDTDPAAVEVEVSDTTLHLVLSGGRELSAPLAWFPRVRDATLEQRAHWRLIGGGPGIRLPDVDEDISVRALLGRPS